MPEKGAAEINVTKQVTRRIEGPTTEGAKMGIWTTRRTGVTYTGWTNGDYRTHLHAMAAQMSVMMTCTTLFTRVVVITKVARIMGECMTNIQELMETTHDGTDKHGANSSGMISNMYRWSKHVHEPFFYNAPFYVHTHAWSSLYNYNTHLLTKHHLRSQFSRLIFYAGISV